MPGFRGTFEHTLDAKHRLTIPARFRAELAGGVVLAASMETDAETPRAIGIWTPEAYDAYTSEVLDGINPALPRARELSRFFFANSLDTELDAANRVMLPPNLMNYAGLSKDATVIGAGPCLEVFDRVVYDAYSKGVLTRVPEIAASLGHTS